MIKYVRLLPLIAVAVSSICFADPGWGMPLLQIECPSAQQVNDFLKSHKIPYRGTHISIESSLTVKRDGEFAVNVGKFTGYVSTGESVIKQRKVKINRYSNLRPECFYQTRQKNGKIYTGHMSFTINPEIKDSYYKYETRNDYYLFYKRKW